LVADVIGAVAAATGVSLAGGGAAAAGSPAAGAPAAGSSAIATADPKNPTTPTITVQSLINLITDPPELLLTDWKQLPGWSVSDFVTTVNSRGH
jgi:hypothetical protein